MCVIQVKHGSFDDLAKANMLEFAANISNMSSKVVYPDTSKMLVYDPKQNPGTGAGTNAFDEILKATPPALVAFLANLPTVYGPTPNVDIVLSICLQNDLPMGQSGKIGIQSQLPGGPAPATSELSGSNHYGKRKELDRQEDDDATSLQSQPPPRDAFRIRQFLKARANSTSQTGSVSCGSALSGDLSGSTSR